MVAQRGTTQDSGAAPPLTGSVMGEEASSSVMAMAKVMHNRIKMAVAKQDASCCGCVNNANPMYFAKLLFYFLF